jgi:hypothetical protein
MGDRREPDRDTRHDEQQALEEIRVLFARYRQVARHGMVTERRACRAPGRRVKGHSGSGWPLSAAVARRRASKRSAASRREEPADDAKCSKQRRHVARRTWMPARARVTLGAPHHLGGMR